MKPEFPSSPSLSGFPSSSRVSVFAVLLLAGMAIGLFSPLLFAGIPPLFGLIGYGLYYRAEQRFPAFDYGVMWAGLAVCALLFTGSFWSVTPDASVERAFKLAPLILLSCLAINLCRDLSPHHVRFFEKWAALPLIFAAAILYIELSFNYPLRRFFGQIPAETYLSRADVNKHVGTLILLVPVVLALALRARSIIWPVLLMIMSGMVLSATESQSAQLSAFVMIFSVPLLILMPKAAPVLVFGLTAFFILFMPWIGPVAFDAFAEPLAQKQSVLGQANMSMRLENWDFLSRRIHENPWTGFGLDSTRAMVFDTDQLYFKGNTIVHPHNLALQIWIEFGVGGAVAALGFLLFLYRRLAALPLRARIIPFAVFCGGMVFLMVSWSIWASWLDGLILWLAALLTLAIKPIIRPMTS